MRRRTLRPPRWPPGLDGLRVGLVGDLHAGAPQVDDDRVRRVAARLARERVDIVALVGDFVDTAVTGGEPVAPERVAAALGVLRAPLGRWAVLGNHDWKAGGPAVADALRAEGIVVLENEAARVAGARTPLWVVGVADATARDPRPLDALRDVPPEAAVLALAHDPDVFPRIPERVALTLSGHTHGGQVDIPLLRRHVIPSRFGDRYARGHVVEGGRHLFVTSGVGTSRHPVRFRVPPEIVILTLRSA